MRITILGTGYVGLVLGAGLADFGLEVTCADVDATRVEQLKRVVVPFFEPGLEELIKRHLEGGHLSFTADLAAAIRSGEVLFIAVGTPSNAEGVPDVSQIEQAGEIIARHSEGFKLVVVKSTVPVGTARRLGETIQKKAKARADLEVASNPEFLREGSAIHDFLHPDRVIVGTESERGASILRHIYRPLYLIETPFVFTTLETAELIKYASNAFLAVKITLVNEMANLCDRLGADVRVLAQGMGLDKRIGPKFLHPGPGFGGSCLPKDCLALVHLARQAGLEIGIVEAAIKANERQHRRVIEKLRRGLGSLAGKTVAVWGLTFKPNTSDMREARSLLICRALLEEGCELQLYDPVAMAEVRQLLPDHRIHYCSSALEAATNADAVLLATEWNEFRNIDLYRVREVMAGQVLVDAKNVYEVEEAGAKGFRYFGVGRGETEGGERGA